MRYALSPYGACYFASLVRLPPADRAHFITAHCSNTMLTPRLAEILQSFDHVAIAVSGGVYSVTLAEYAHRLLGRARVTMLHAVSPAVPGEATARLAAFGWDLQVIDAGEMANPDYVANPVNRCFFCKTSLYAAMRRLTDRVLLSGTNRDDLGDFRPGLAAAAVHGVRHPFVEADMDKAAVRSLARALGLTAVAELPASPCLASRIETGIAVAPQLLGFVHAVESLVRAKIGDGLPVRCRVRSSSVVIELGDEVGAVRPGGGQVRGAAPTNAMTIESLRAEVSTLMAEHGIAKDLSFAPYVMGSAFLR